MAGRKEGKEKDLIKCNGLQEMEKRNEVGTLEKSWKNVMDQTLEVDQGFVCHLGKKHL